VIYLRGVSFLSILCILCVDLFDVTVHWCDRHRIWYCCCTEKHCGLLSDFLHQLVELAQTGDDNSCSEVAVEAGRCLGVIGIVDIGLVSRRAPAVNHELESALSALQHSAEMQQYCHIFHALSDYLTDSQLVMCHFSVYIQISFTQTCRRLKDNTPGDAFSEHINCH